MLYHRDIGFPANLRLPRGAFSLSYSGHAAWAAENDRYGNFLPSLPAYIDTDKATPIEVEIKGNRIEKIVYRVRISPRFDLVLAVVPLYNVWRVKTVWANMVADDHKTLNASKYDRP